MDVLEAAVRTEKLGSTLREARASLEKAEKIRSQIVSVLKDLPRAEGKLLRVWSFFLAASHVYYAYAGVPVPEEYRDVPFILTDDRQKLEESCRKAGEAALKAVEAYINELKETIEMAEHCFSSARSLLSAFVGQVEEVEETA